MAAGHSDFLKFANREFATPEEENASAEERAYAARIRAYMATMRLLDEGVLSDENREALHAEKQREYANLLTEFTIMYPGLPTDANDSFYYRSTQARPPPRVQSIDDSMPPDVPKLRKTDSMGDQGIPWYLRPKFMPLPDEHMPHAMADMPHAMAHMPHSMAHMPHAMAHMPHAMPHMPHAMPHMPHMPHMHHAMPYIAQDASMYAIPEDVDASDGGYASDGDDMSKDDMDTAEGTRKRLPSRARHSRKRHSRKRHSHARK